MHPFFNLFGLNLPAYGLMILVGVGAGTGVVMLRRKRFGLQREDALFLIALAVAGAIVGAKLLYILVNIPWFIQHWELVVQYPVEMLAELAGGLVFYGGVIGAFLLCGWYIRKYKLKLLPTLDAFAPAVPLAHAMGRVGCFLSGCCFGAEADWGIVYTEAIPHDANGVPRIPVQLFEAAGDTLIVLILLLYMRKPRKSGRGFALYLLLYAPLRFVLEFFRGDIVRGGLWALSTSQWLSFLFLAAGLYFWLRPDKARDAAQPLPPSGETRNTGNEIVVDNAAASPSEGRV